MKISPAICFLIATLFILQGCIDINEEITINPDGSGTISLAVDAGMIGSSINSQNSQFDVSILEQIRKIPGSASQALGEMKGIKNIKAVSDDKKGLYSVGFDFADQKVLNKAIYSLAGKKKSVFSPSFIKISKHKLIKKDLSPYIRKIMTGKKLKSYNNLFLSFINYKSTFHLPSDVKNVSNIKSGQPDKRTVTTNFTLEEMLKGDFNFGNVIKF
jgi:hypothetical protein